MSSTETMIFFGQQCALAGKPVPQRFLDDYDGDPSECADWVVVELSESEVSRYEAQRGAYYQRLAAAIRERL